MTSIERTAYPRFKRLMSAREIHVFFTPKPEEAAWVHERTRSDEHLLALALALKCYQKLGYFPKADDVPEAVVEHVRGALELAEGTGPHYESVNTAKLHRKLVRERQGISYDQERARQIAEEAIRRAALVKNNPPDLINVALEELVRATCELPAFRTLDEMAARVRELSAITNRHLSVDKINEAITDVVNAFMRLDLVKAWGDGTSVAADGTQMDTFIDNLLAETSIRYGGFGGIAYHHISDQYIALFSRFIPRGVWEAVYIIDGLLKNASEMKPDTIHVDTQGQSFPVFCLAHLLGFGLMPKIRNWQDRTFYRPSASVRYRHIDALFDQGGRNVIDWRLIEAHWRDLMRVSIAIREGTLASPLLLWRLGSNSKRNQIYQAFREVGRAVATVQLLRFISDPSLRLRVTAATNKVESFNNFSDWLVFCNGGVIAENDPVEQEKAVKLTSLLANCVIFHTTLDLMNVIRELQAEEWQITGEDLAAISPYLTDHIMRFGTYTTTELTVRPDAFDPHLDVEFEAEEPEPAAA